MSRYTTSSDVGERVRRCGQCLSADPVPLPLLPHPPRGRASTEVLTRLRPTTKVIGRTPDPADPAVQAAPQSVSARFCWTGPTLAASASSRAARTRTIRGRPQSSRVRHARRFQYQDSDSPQSTRRVPIRPARCVNPAACVSRFLLNPNPPWRVRSITGAQHSPSAGPRPMTGRRGQRGHSRSADRRWSAQHSGSSCRRIAKAVAALSRKSPDGSTR